MKLPYIKVWNAAEAELRGEFIDFNVLKIVI
jgi:hypothetical protein